MSLARRWTESRESRRRRREDRLALRAERKGRKHEYGAGKSHGDLWKGGGR
jgi:hypothetical protein